MANKGDGMEMTRDTLLHALGGAVIALLFPPWFGVTAALLVGYAREIEQHVCAAGTRQGWWRLSSHKHTEAFAWGAGALMLTIAVRWLT